MPKSVLLIAYNYPPLISPQSIRWLYLSRELNKLGYKIDVLTINMPQRFKDLTEMIPKESNIYRVFPGVFYHITYKYSREKSKTDVTSNSKNSPDAIYRLYLLIHSICNTFLIPDIYSEWLPHALLKGYTVMKENKYDVIISSSEPRVCHLVAYVLKRFFPVKWIADYGDPWVYPVSTQKDYMIKKKIIKRIEAHILKYLDFITLAADGIKSLYLKEYSFLQDKKIEVITQGYDPELFEAILAEKGQKDFVLTYCGSFFKNLRDPSNFFNGLKGLNIPEMKVKIAGRINEFVENLKEGPLDKIIEYKGFINHKDSLYLEKNSTLLIFISNAIDTQIPGKIYEYIGAKRPILCITDNSEDLSSRLIKDTNRGIVVSNDSEEIKAGILKFYNLWKDGKLDNSFNLNDLDGFTWHYSAKKISEVIDKL